MPQGRRLAGMACLATFTSETVEQKPSRMNPSATTARFVVAAPFRTTCDPFARVLEHHGKLRFLGLGTRRGTQGVSRQRTRLFPVIGLANYIGVCVLSQFRAESFRPGADGRSFHRLALDQGRETSPLRSAAVPLCPPSQLGATGCVLRKRRKANYSAGWGGTLSVGKGSLPGA